jgi:hypothetical protein
MMMRKRHLSELFIAKLREADTIRRPTWATRPFVDIEK